MKPYQAAICEDNGKSLQFLHTQLNTYFEKNDMLVTFHCYTSANELLSDILSGKSYDFFFLDIEMPELDGLTLSKKIYHNFPDAIIIFISNKEELVFKTFEVHPFRFIRKNHFKEELPQLITDIKNELANQAGSFLTITEQGGTTYYTINVYDILYIESNRKYCRIVLVKDTIELKYNLSDFATLLQPYGFLQPHRSYLVNYRFIFSIKKDTVLLDNKVAIPLSRKRIDEIKNEFIVLSQEVSNDYATRQN